MVTWGTSPEDALPINGARARSRFRARRGQAGEHEARAGLHGPQARHADGLHRGRPRLHRLLHQQPHRGLARGGQGRQGPQGRSPGVGRGGLGPHQGAGRGRRPRPDLPRRRLRMARARLLDVHRRQRRYRHAAASASPRPPTATSSAARARACAPTSSARRWPRPPPSPATSPTCASCWARSTHHGRLHHPHRRRRAARSGQHRHRPDHPGALPRQAARRARSTATSTTCARPQRTAARGRDPQQARLQGREDHRRRTTTSPAAPRARTPSR